MKKIRTRLTGLKRSSVMMAYIFLLACGGQASDKASESGKTLPQPGMHVYKDPVTGEFVAQPPVEDKSSIRVLPQSLQQSNNLDDAVEPQSEPTREYESSTEGGGMLLDLPAPYSGSQE